MREFQKRLLAWYRRNARKDLPWRKSRDPYRIWISETMLQQTQVATVIPYYDRFLKRFPTVQALADAPPTKVLEGWAGLGYYSRAKNLHRAAQKICREHGGRIPQEARELLELPGVGRYTAGAVASIAYDRPAPILDGNITRLLCRWRGIREDPRSPQIQKKLWGLSEQLVLEESPGEFNQALMELGALVCTPRRPRCLTCPVRKDCRARKLGLQDRIPMPRRHAPRRRIRYLCGILERNGSLLLARRPLSGLLPGLWELPGGERSPGESEAEGLARNLRERLGLQVEPTGLRLRAEVEQTLTHRELQIRAFSCRWKGRPRPQGYPEVRWAPKRSLNQLPLTTGMRRVADQL